MGLNINHNKTTNNKTTKQPTTNMSSKMMSITIDPKVAFVVGAKKELSLGAKSVALYEKTPEGQRPISLQTQWCRSFGINKWPTEQSPEDTTPPKLSVTISFDGQDELKGFFERLDEWAIDHVHANSWDLLKTKNVPRDTIAFNYTRCVKVPVDKTTGEPNGKPATMKLKLTRDEAPNAKTGMREYSAAFFNTDKQIIPADDVESFFSMGSRIRVLIQCTGFWIAAGKFGLSWKLKQAIIDPPSRIGKEYAFDDGDEDEEEPAAKRQKVAAPAAAASLSKPLSDDFDEDGMTDSAPAAVAEVVAPVPAPAPAPVAAAAPAVEADPDVPAVPKKVVRKANPVGSAPAAKK